MVERNRHPIPIYCKSIYALACNKNRVILNFEVLLLYWLTRSNRNPQNNYNKVRKGAKIRNRYNQVPHLTQDTNGKVTSSQLYTTNESQEVSHLPVGDHKAQINRRAQRHNKQKTEKNITLQRYILFVIATSYVLFHSFQFWCLKPDCPDDETELPLPATTHKLT